MKNKKANWTLPAIFGFSGLLMFIDSIWWKVLLPSGRFFEGLIGILLVVLAIWMQTK